MHYMLPSSGAPIWAHCAGSVLMQAAHPDDDTEEAREGTASHWVMEQALLSHMPGHDSGLKLVGDFVGKQAPNGVVIDEAMSSGAGLMVRDVLKVAQEFGVLNRLLVEQRVEAPQVHPLQGGTLDAAVYIPEAKRLYLWDYKFGHIVVEAFENWQAICYYAGLYNLLKLDGLIDQELQVHIRIVQPRAYHRYGPVREWVVNAADLRAHLNHLVAQGEKAFQDNAETVSGPHCIYCKARHDCETGLRAGQTAMAIVGNSQRNDMRPEDAGKQLALLKAAKKMLDSQITGLEAYVEGLVERGDVATGYCIERPNGRKRWKQDIPKEEIIALGALFGKELSKIELITPTQAVNLDIPEAIINDFSETPLGKPKLVEAEKTIAHRAFNTR